MTESLTRHGYILSLSITVSPHYTDERFCVVGISAYVATGDCCCRRIRESPGGVGHQRAITVSEVTAHKQAAQCRPANQSPAPDPMTSSLSAMRPCCYVQYQASLLWHRVATGRSSSTFLVLGVGQTRSSLAACPNITTGHDFHNFIAEAV